MTDRGNSSVTPLSAALGLARRVPAPSPAALYDAWLILETEASLALAAWRSAARADKGRAHAVYVNALAAEEAAAARLEQRLAVAA